MKELIDLLREARDWVDQVGVNLSTDPTRFDPLVARINAALAAHEAEPERDWRKLAEQAYELLAIDTADSINGAYELLHAAFNGEPK